jgi:hypothetical protein
MTITKKILSSFAGIFLGSFFSCTVLFLFKDANYMHFWGYAGFIYYPIYVFILFLLPIVTGFLLKNLFRGINEALSAKNLFFTGIFFALEGILAANIISKLLEKIFTTENFLYYVVTLILIPIISFWVILWVVQGANSVIKYTKNQGHTIKFVKKRVPR